MSEIKFISIFKIPTINAATQFFYEIKKIKIIETIRGSEKNDMSNGALYNFIEHELFDTISDERTFKCLFTT